LRVLHRRPNELDRRKRLCESLQVGREAADTDGMGLADRDYVKSEKWQAEQQQRLAEWQWRAFERMPSAPRRPSPVGHVLLVVLIVVVSGSIGFWAGTRTQGSEEPAPGGTPVFVWGGESFTSRSEFEQWLSERGIAYTGWEKAHPAAAAKLDGMP
jgi:hypothetical protein